MVARVMPDDQLALIKNSGAEVAKVLKLQVATIGQHGHCIFGPNGDLSKM